ncbi:MAG TPA: class I SAM-dependent methyltransferase [Mycobacterium sp.]|jgi:SAM-dependent methyltransferase|nr:class I SAM-dependent methyltransferase [Mycobacterium sp.]
MDAQSPPPPAIPADDDELHQMLVAKFRSRTISSWALTAPAIPSLIDEYIDTCDKMLVPVSRPWASLTREDKRDMLAPTIQEAFDASPRSRVTLDWDSNTDVLRISARVQSISDSYDSWLDDRGWAPFGTHADARVWLLAEELSGGRRDIPILDIGAGVGRNAIALARHGYPVDAVELAPRFAAQIRANADYLELTNIRVLACDVFDTEDLRDDYQLIFAAEVATDWQFAQCRNLFELAAKRLAPGGLLLFSAFIARQGYTPTQVARELGQHALCRPFTADEMTEAAAGLPLELIADDSVYDYEKGHLPKEAWPPAIWFEAWATGNNLFAGAPDASPMQLRWLVYRRNY